MVSHRPVGVVYSSSSSHFIGSPLGGMRCFYTRVNLPSAPGGVALLNNNFIIHTSTGASERYVITGRVLLRQKNPAETDLLYCG